MIKILKNTKKYFKKFFLLKRKSRINKLEYRFEIDIFNCKYFYKNNRYHNDKDLPAVIWKSGTRYWYKNGVEHRDNNKPSTIYSDGLMFWYENGYFIRNNLNEFTNK